MKMLYWAVLVLVMLALPLRAETPEAEAQRRGVAVTQVQDERALLDETKKTVELQTQLDALKKQLADLQAKQDAGPADGTPMYKDFVDRYMAGYWANLLDDMKAKEAQITALPAEKAADLQYIKDAISEGRQPWWEAIKVGKNGPFKVTVWKKTFDMRFTTGAGKYSGPAAAGQAMAVSWPKEQMDSFDAISLADVGVALQGNFRRGDGLSQLIWGYMGFGDVFTQISPQKIAALPPQDKEQFQTYGGFISGVTTAYYGTPPARRMMMVQCLASFEPMNDGRPDWLGKRPIGAAILIERKLHPDIHPKSSTTEIYGLDKAAENGHEYEQLKAVPIMLGMSGTKFSFAEDKAYREMFKTLGENNGAWDSAKIALPNSLNYNLDVGADLPLAAERQKFLAGGK